MELGGVMDDNSGVICATNLSAGLRCLACACAVVFAALPGGAVAREGASRLNVVVVVADSLGWQDLPWQSGDDGGKETALANFAAEGMEFLHFYSCPQGTATRASLLTGRYHYRTGVAGDEFGENVMHGYEITVAEAFRDNGYATGYFGTWENGRNFPSDAVGQGFDALGAGVEEAGKFVSESASAATAGDGEPFFCWLSLPEQLLIEQVDAAFAALLNAIETSGSTDDTLVIFLADCGSGGRIRGVEEQRESGALPKLLGARGSVHEAGVRVPFLVRCPGQIPAGTETREISAAIDLLPSLVDLCALTFVETLPTDGISLAELWITGGKPRRWPNRILFTSATPPAYDVKNASVSVRTGRWLAIREPAVEAAWQLYDMHADPYQRYDVAEQQWSLAAHLSADFAVWMMHTTENGLAPVPTELGHRQAPEVALASQDAIFPGSAGGEDQAATPERQKWRWPVEAVAREPSRYRVSL